MGEVHSRPSTKVVPRGPSVSPRQCCAALCWYVLRLLTVRLPRWASICYSHTHALPGRSELATEKTELLTISEVNVPCSLLQLAVRQLPLAAYNHRALCSFQLCPFPHTRRTSLAAPLSNRLFNQPAAAASSSLVCSLCSHSFEHNTLLHESLRRGRKAKPHSLTVQRHAFSYPSCLNPIFCSHARVRSIHAALLSARPR